MKQKIFLFFFLLSSSNLLFFFVGLTELKASVERGDYRKPQYADSIPKPTLSEVAYGPHEHNVLDFWKAKSDKPTPLAFVIHGGGWKNGSKERLSRFVDAPALLNAGISVVAINYRLIKSNSELQLPVQAWTRSS